MKLNLLFLLLFLLGELKAQTNLTITTYTELNTDGNYNITIGDQGFLHITGGHINLLNVNINSGAKGLTIDFNTKVNINSSLNINGGFIFTNKSPDTKINGNVEVQGGNNIVYISANLKTNVFQLLDKTSKVYIQNCGTIFTSEHAATLNGAEGSFILENGAQFTANGGLDINSPNIITGKGFVRINGNGGFNLNHNFTKSTDITLCYKGHLNDPNKTGSAVLSCEYSCTSLPVKLEYFNAKRISNTEIQVNFRFSDLDKMSKTKVLIGKDIKNMKSYLVIDRSKLESFKNYSFNVNYEN